MKNKQLRLALILALGCTAAQARDLNSSDNDERSKAERFFGGLFQGPVAVTQDAGEGVVGVVTLDTYGDASGLVKTVPDAATWGHYRKTHSDDDQMNNNKTRNTSSKSTHESSFDRWRARHDERRDERHEREEKRRKIRHEGEERHDSYNNQDNS